MPQVRVSRTELVIHRYDTVLSLINGTFTVELYRAARRKSKIHVRKSKKQYTVNPGLDMLRNPGLEMFKQSYYFSN